MNAILGITIILEHNLITNTSGFSYLQNTQVDFIPDVKSVAKLHTFKKIKLLK